MLNRVHEGIMNIRTPQGLIPNYFVLTKHSLYQWEQSYPYQQPSKSYEVLCKRVQAWTCQDGNKQWFALQLSRENFSQEFSIEEESDLEQWLAALSQTSIMSDVKNDFEFGEVIGRGGWGQVVKGVSHEDGKTYAIKKISKSLLEKSDLSHELFFNEINTMRQLRHKGVLKLKSVYEGKNSFYLVTEYLKGGNLLERLLQKGPLPEVKAKKLLKNILKAVAHIHKNNIVHRDLKLENILMLNSRSDTKIRVADFGIAACTQLDQFDHGGTPQYSAPEQLLSSEISFKSDIYSIGIIAFMILTTLNPYNTHDIEGIFSFLEERRKISFEPLISMGVSEETMNFIEALTSYNPEERPTAREALNII